MSQQFAVGLATVSLILAASGMATAQTPEPQPPSPRQALEWMVLNEINGAYFDRANPINRPPLIERVPDGVIRQVDISHDGVADWLVDYTDSGLMYCGTGGCLRSLYVSVADDGHVLAFNDQSYDLSIGSRNGETIIDMAVHQVMCRPASDDCAYSFAWAPQQSRLVERPNVRGVTLLSSGFGVLALPEEDQPRPPEEAPSVLQERWRETVQACPSVVSAGAFNIVHADIQSVPDLDGDNMRDWFFQGPADCSGGDGTQGDQRSFMIYLTRTSGEAVLAFTSGPGEQPLYDIATTPAMLVSNPECGSEVACRNMRLRWDSRTARFVPAG